MPRQNRKKTFKSSSLLLDKIPAIQALKRSNFYLERFEHAWSIWQDKYPNLPARLVAFHSNQDSNQKSGEVVIECANHIVSNHLRHLNKSLLDHFHKYGAKQITSIKLSIAKTKPEPATSKPEFLEDDRVSETQKVKQQSLSKLRSLLKQTH